MTNQRQSQLNSLTGLRFVAAMMVFVSHLLRVFPFYETEAQASHIVAPLGLGGVGFFYVLSGFILTYVYSNRSESFSFRDFYIKRIARVWPLHLATMAIVLFGVISVSHQLGRQHGLAQIVANIFLLQSWSPNYEWVFCINGPSWSLSNEAFFYFVFPWLLAGGASAFGRKFLAYGCVGAAVLTAASFFPSGIVSSEMAGRLVRANPLFRLFDFMTGMAVGFMFIEYQKRAVAVEESGRRRSRAGSALFQLGALLSCVAYFWVMNYCVGDWNQLVYSTKNVATAWLCFSGAAPLFALAIFAFARDASWFSRLFATRTMVYLGEVSFAFYLIHQPVQTLLSRETFRDSPLAIWWMASAALLLSLAAAMVLHQLIELPSRAGLIRLFAKSNSDQSWIARSRVLLSEYRIATLELCCSPRIVVAIGMLIAGVSLAEAGRFNHHDPTLIGQVVQQTSDEFREIQFDQDAVLKGLVIDPQPDGSCQIQMVWDLQKGRRPVRFLHICDSEGKILRHGNANRSMFSRAKGDEIVLDRVTVSKEELGSAAMLAVGFYGPDRKSSPIVNPSPGQPAHRLPILRLDRRAAKAPIVR